MLLRTLGDRRRPVAGVVTWTSGGALAAGVTAAALMAGVDTSLQRRLALAAGFAAVGWLAGHDGRTGRIPNRIVLPALAVYMAVAAGSSALAGSSAHLVDALIGLAVVSVPWAVVNLATAGEVVGGGDVKLAALLGALAGVVDPVAAELTLLLSLAGWLLVGLVVKFRSRRASFVFGPTLAVAGILALALTVVVVAGPDVPLVIETR